MDSFNMVAATGSYQFKIDHSKTKDMDIGKVITSRKFRVGEHDWAIRYFPWGFKEDKGGEYISVFLQLIRGSVDVSAVFELSLVDKCGNSSSIACKRSSHKFTASEEDWGFSSFLQRTKLEETFVEDGNFFLKVSITLKDESWTGAHQITSPVGFLQERIQKFREEKTCTDVTFNVNGNHFVAHRLILAAHSPVFKAELIGSMAESNQDQITINEMMPSIFKAMLDFMYSGSLPAVQELGNNEEVTAFFENLLVAADCYVVEKLKSVCEHNLVKSISLGTVLSLLELAENHNSSDLKTECLKFVVEKDNSVSLMVSEEYIKLVQRYPSLLAELKALLHRGVEEGRGEEGSADWVFSYLF